MVGRLGEVSDSIFATGELGRAIGMADGSGVRRPAMARAAIEQIGVPFGARVATGRPSPESAPVARWISAVTFGGLTCGFAASILFWVRCWRRVLAARSSAIPLSFDLPIPAMRTALRIEPRSIRHLEPGAVAAGGA